jgi:undecaprenyl-diphosphatase
MTRTSVSPWWRSTWPLDRCDAARLAIWLALVVAVGVVIGESLTNWSLFDGVVDLDRRVARDLWGAFIANTPVKIALSLVVAGLVTWRFRRWHEALMVAVPLIFEATAFVVISFIVGRPRPPVERLLDSPVDTSFPSGHVAAATVYAAFAVIVFWHTRAVWARAIVAVVVVAAPLVVGWARMYQGMHYLTDVTAGIALGVTSVVIVVSILGPPPDADAPAGSQVRADRLEDGGSTGSQRVDPVPRRSRPSEPAS